MEILKILFPALMLLGTYLLYQFCCRGTVLSFSAIFGLSIILKVVDVLLLAAVVAVFYNSPPELVFNITLLMLVIGVQQEILHQTRADFLDFVTIYGKDVDFVLTDEVNGREGEAKMRNVSFPVLYIGDEKLNKQETYKVDLFVRYDKRGEPEEVYCNLS